MVKKLHFSTRLVLLSALLNLSLPGDADAASASEYFADANRLARDDLYWAALLRYEQAKEEGLDSALLHYNTGITHYRAGQHSRARDELVQALRDSGLRVAAQYNLGLNAYKLGEADEALRWFRLARDQETNKKIQTFAVVAISRIRDAQAEPDDFEIREVERERKRDLADFLFHVRVGYGSDDNVFRTSSLPYIDRSDPAAPTVRPVVQSGAFVPVNMGAKFRINSFKFEGFYGAYRVAGRYYADETLENANEYQHEASFGNEYYRKEGNRVREVSSAFKVSQHVETYYDPDDGSDRNIGGVLIDDRLNYLRYGPELRFRQSYERLGFGAKIKGQLWNYEDQTVVPEYDHDFLSLSLYGQFKFTPSSLLRVTLEGYSRRYSDRPSYDLDGQPRIGNPEIRYDYYALALTARQRVFDSFWFGFEVKHLERIDQYVGYNDYKRDDASIELHWSPGNRFDFDASGTYRLYDYANAFAFHNPTLQRKTQEAVVFRATGKYRLSRRFYLLAEARYNETVSNDTRIQYARGQYFLSLTWEQ